MPSGSVPQVWVALWHSVMACGQFSCCLVENRNFSFSNIQILKRILLLIFKNSGWMFHTKVWVEQMTSTSYFKSKRFCGSDVPQQTSPGGTVEGEKEKGPTSVLLLPFSAPGGKKNNCLECLVCGSHNQPEPSLSWVSTITALLKFCLRTQHTGKNIIALNLALCLKVWTVARTFTRPMQEVYTLQNPEACMCQVYASLELFHDLWDLFLSSFFLTPLLLLQYGLHFKGNMKGTFCSFWILQLNSCGPFTLQDIQGLVWNEKERASVINLWLFGHLGHTMCICCKWCGLMERLRA